jgi:predicted small secreted protein
MRSPTHRFVIVAASAVLLAACAPSEGDGTGTQATGPTSSNAQVGRIAFVRASLDGSPPHVFTI